MRHICLVIWYFLVVIPRLVLISLLISFTKVEIRNIWIMACFILFTLVKSIVINWLQKLNYDNVTHFGFYTNDFCKSILNFGYLTVGVNKNVFFEFKNIFWQRLFDEIEKNIFQEYLNEHRPICGMIF